MTRTATSARRGVATVMAIVLIGLLAVVLTTLSAWGVAEQRRGFASGADAQASQLLNAGAVIARQQRADGKVINGPVETPLGRILLSWNGAVCDVDVSVAGVGRHVVLTFDGTRLARVD